MKKMLLIGNGRMGSAVGGQFKKSFDMTVVDPTKPPDYKASYYRNLSEVRDYHDYVTFAVKPMLITEVINQLNKSVYDNRTEFLSIIAGVKKDYYKNILGKDMNITTMVTNLPAKVGKGIIAVCSEKKFDFLNDCGEVIYTKDEDDIDKFTAFIGSGPGFCYSIMDMMHHAVEKLEFKTEMDQEKVIIGLLEGALAYLKENKKSFEDNKNMVTTPQGTTMAGLEELEKSQEMFDNTFDKAYQKASELGDIVRKKL